MTYIIYKDGEEINRIAADEEFARAYCEENGYTFELQPEPEPLPATPGEEEDTAAMLVDHELRLTLLELGLEGGEI